MFTCFAVGSTLCCIPMLFLTAFTKRITLSRGHKPKLTIEGFFAFGLMVFFTTPVCALTVWLWQQVLA